MIDRNKKKTMARTRRQHRVRATVLGTAARPRLSVYRSLGHITAQVIDDESGRTLAAAADTELGKDVVKDAGERTAKVAVAFALGMLIAEKAKKAGVTAVVFDRNGFAYHGRVAAVADGAREHGLKF